MYALYCVWQRKVNEDGAEAASSTDFSSNGYSSPVDTSDFGSPKPLEQTPHGDFNRPSSRQSPSPPLHQMPALFSDSGWEKINNTILSTSNCGNPSLRHFGFGPVSGDGFGIGYIIKDETISFCASSKHRQTKRFVDSLESYLNEIRRVLKLTRQKDMGGAKVSRAREIDEKGKDGRLKSRGRVIRADANKQDGAGVQTPTTEPEEVEDDGLGGYGFFDAGMLLQALRRDKDGPTPAEHTVRRKAVGKKLALSEY